MNDPIERQAAIENVPTAQPNTPTDTPTDLISRQAAIRWVKTECNPYGKPTLEFESGKKVIEHLKQMPSAQPEISRIEQELHGKTPEEQYEFLYWLLFEFALTYTDSRLAVIEWLRGNKDNE